MPRARALRFESGEGGINLPRKPEFNQPTNHPTQVGGYDLICLDRGHGGYGGNVGDQWDAVDASGQLGADACFASGWVDKLTGLVRNFVNKTGLSMLETDGPYGGGSCASTKHAHHDGLEDSIYRQTMMQNEFYAMARELGLYVNQPDNYFFNGGQKTGEQSSPRAD